MGPEGTGDFSEDFAPPGLTQFKTPVTVVPCRSMGQRWLMRI